MRKLWITALVLAIGLSGLACSFADEEGRARIDGLEGRLAAAEAQQVALESRVADLEKASGDQALVLQEMSAEIEAQAYERRYEEQHEEIWESALAAARCYVSSDPSVARDYPGVAPERLVETVASEMYEEYRQMLAVGGLETSRILELIGSLKLACAQ